MSWFLLTALVASWLLFYWIADMPINHIGRYLLEVKRWKSCEQCGLLTPPDMVRSFVLPDERVLHICPGCCSALGILDMLTKEVGPERANKLLDKYVFTLELLGSKEDGKQNQQGQAIR